MSAVCPSVASGLPISANNSFLFFMDNAPHPLPFIGSRPLAADVNRWKLASFAMAAAFVLLLGYSMKVSNDFSKRECCLFSGGLICYNEGLVFPGGETGTEALKPLCSQLQGMFLSARTHGIL